MLSDKQLEDVCLAFDPTSSRCRYLDQDGEDMHKFYCLKKMIDRKAIIDLETKNYITDSQKKGEDPYKKNVPLGDNCGGYPKLKYLVQGYDQG